MSSPSKGGFLLSFRGVGHPGAFFCGEGGASSLYKRGAPFLERHWG